MSDADRDDFQSFYVERFKTCFFQFKAWDPGICVFLETIIIPHAQRISYILLQVDRDGTGMAEWPEVVDAADMVGVIVCYEHGIHVVNVVCECLNAHIRR